MQTSYSTKSETNKLNDKVNETIKNLETVSDDFYGIKNMIEGLNVKGFK